MNKVDLNCDLGESFGNYKLGLDEEVIKYISSANIACGFHASDPLVMEKTVAMAKENGVAIGAHPGYPDLVGFGRRNMNISPKEVKAMVIYQIGALAAFCKAGGLSLQHVKPHGGMYNMAGKDAAWAEAICEAIYDVDPGYILLAPGNGEMSKAAARIGLKCAREVFADRAYEEDGSLVARSKPGAVITDENVAIERVVSMVKYGKVTAITGKEIAVEAESICVHGDGVKAVEFVKKIKERLSAEGIAIAPMGKMI